MRPIRLSHTLIACILASLLASAQSHSTLQFRIIDDADEPVAYAVVVAVNELDSITSAPAFSSETGEVSLALDDAAAYTALKVQCMGYVTATIPLPLASATIVLAKDPNMLGEVVVKAGPALQQKNGKFIFNPSELYSRSTDAYTVLRYTPLLTVGDSQISILGKGNSKIYINGRDPLMDSQGVMTMLKSLPPERIKKIEIITSPGASQAASMTGGIINVVLDNPAEGYFGSLTGNIRYLYERVSTSLASYNAYTIGKLRSSAMFSYSNSNAFADQTSFYDYTVLNKTVTNYTRGKSHGNNLGARLNFAYDFTPSSTLGLAFTVTDGSTSRNQTVESSEVLSDGTPTNSYTRILTKYPWSKPNYTAIGSYNLRFDNIKGELNVQASFSHRNNYVNTDYIYDGNSPVEQKTHVRSNGFHLKPMYKQKFGPVHSLEAGYDLLCSNINNVYQYPGQDNRFKYEEMINSAFANWSASWSDAFYTRVGMRMENTDIDTRQTVGNETSSRNYTDFFPSLYASINLPGGGNQSLSFSLNRYIHRPYYSDLNPFVYWGSPTTYQKGNTQLKPSYEWSYSIYYSFLKYFVFNVIYNTADNSVNNYVYMDENGNTVTSTANFGNSKFFGASLSFSKTIAKIWYLKAQASLYRSLQKATLGSYDIGYKDNSFTAQIVNSITLSQKYSVYLDAWYNLISPTQTLHGKNKYRNNLSIEISKQFSNGLSIKFQADNIFGTKSIENYTSPEYSYRHYTDNIQQSFTLNVSYVFGKKRIKRAQNIYDNSVDSRFKN
ncbi:MAG: outer membrane beta-barrel protein [Paramuribaculum sp.]|nr:outer membrane beta-barrel protein [Paramuribaculum sp.]